MSANPMVELGHADLADLADPDEIDGPDEHVDADLAWGPGVTPDAGSTPGRPAREPFVAVGISAAAHADGYFAAQRVTRAAQDAENARRRSLTPPAPQTPAQPLTRAQLAERGAGAAVQLWDAASAAGWTVTAAYARGPHSTEATLCPACMTWARVTKAGAIAVHGPRAARCRTTTPDPASPDYQIVDSVVVRATSPARPARLGGGVHRLAASWVDAGDDPDKAQYKADGAQLWHAGDRPRDIDVVAVRTTLKAIAAGRRPAKAARAKRATS